MKKLMSQLQNSGWMNGNPALSQFSGWNEMHGGSMDRNSSSEMGRRGEAGRRSRVLQLALNPFSPAMMAAAILTCLLMFVSIADAGVAEFKKAHGVVDVFHAGERQARPAAVGDTVNVGDTIRTGRRSRAQLKFADGSVLNLGSLTKIQVGEFSYSAESKVRKSSLRQLRGTIRAVVSKAETEDSFYHIETPGAVAAVRGTITGSKMNSPFDTTFYVTKGSIDVYNKRHPKKRRRVSAGQYTRVVGKRLPTPARKMPASFKNKVLSGTSQKAAAANKESGGAGGSGGAGSAGGGTGGGAAGAPAADPAQGGGTGGRGGAGLGGLGGSGSAALNTGKKQAGPGGQGAALKSVTPPITKSTPAAVNTNVNIVIQF